MIYKKQIAKEYKQQKHPAGVYAVHKIIFTFANYIDCVFSYHKSRKH